MTANYTKGEWNIWIHPDRIPPEGEGIWAIYVADEQGKAIAKVSRDNTDEMKANARLITASPEMYQALQVILGYAESLRNNMLAELASPQEGTQTAEEYLRQMQNAYNALAKAEGRNA